MADTAARVPSRVASRRPSRAGSVVSATSAGAAMENVSFVSYLAVTGRGAGLVADLDTIAAAAASVINTPASEPVLTHDVTEGPSSQHEHRSSASGRSGSNARVAGEGDGELVSDHVSVWATVKQFLLLGYPLSLSSLAQFSLNLVIVSVNGKMLGDVQLGGVSLAVGLLNASGFAFGTGLCGALETVLAHTYGAYERETESIEAEKALARASARAAQNPSRETGQLTRGGLQPALSDNGERGQEDAVSSYSAQDQPPRTLHMYGTYAQRMLIILFVAAFPLGVILIFADLVLKSLGEEPAVLYYTGEFCRLAVFGMPAMLLFPLLQRYYSCQRVTKPLSVAMLAAALANPVLQISFVKMFGFRGSPIAWLLMMSCACAGLVGYLWKTGLYKFTWGGFSEKSTQHLGSLVSLALPSMGMMLSEWVALEVNALAAGFAPTNDLAAYSITLQVFGLMFGVGSGVMILTCVFVGNAVGARKPLAGRKIAFIALGLVVVIALIDILIFIALGSVFPWLFTSEQEVVDIYHRLMYIVLPYHIFDIFQSTVMGIFRGCELQRLGAVIITVVFCVIGVPLSFLLFFYFKLGVIALWIGPFAGVSIVGFPLYMYVLLCYIKWEELKPHTDGKDVSLSSMNDDDSHNGAVEEEHDYHGESHDAQPASDEGVQQRVRDYIDDAATSKRKSTATAAAAATTAAS